MKLLKYFVSINNQEKWPLIPIMISGLLRDFLYASPFDHWAYSILFQQTFIDICIIKRTKLHTTKFQNEAHTCT